MKQAIGFGCMLVMLSLSGIGCIGIDPSDSADSETTGRLALPLVAKQPSGTSYRLADAKFDVVRIENQPYDDSSDCGVTNGKDEGEDNVHMVIRSDDDPNASSIRVALENGQYMVILRPGWRMYKVVDGRARPVNATLTSSNKQWFYINPHRTTSVIFDFTVGGKSIWYYGTLNVGINVNEDAGTYDPPNPTDAGW
jgi:hypothetical protein